MKNGTMVDGIEIEVCRLCCEPLAHPFRQVRDGAVVAGCIAVDHSGHVADAWHTRPVAVLLRKGHRAGGLWCVRAGDVK